jgi:ATP-binding cassette, subfamily B, multidrug efflux pump
MFSLFERLLKPTDPPEQAEPPPGFVAFFWHFARQAKGLFAALFAAGLVVALLDSTIPVFMGRIVTLITASPPDELFAKFWPHLLAMALVLLIARPLALTAQNLIANRRSRRTYPIASGGRTTGTWCASPGHSSRTTSPAASPTG